LGIQSEAPEVKVGDIATLWLDVDNETGKDFSKEAIQTHLYVSGMQKSYNEAMTTAGAGCYHRSCEERITKRKQKRLHATERAHNRVSSERTHCNLQFQGM